MSNYKDGTQEFSLTLLNIESYYLDCVNIAENLPRGRNNLGELADRIEEYCYYRVDEGFIDWNEIAEDFEENLRDGA
tara:strand:+ start:949 stop:1179 length:231 start_codon:yes stop_codon:yes gene_type:complete